MGNDNWFAARLLFAALHNSQEEADPLCEESIVLVRAESELKARQKASDAAAKMEHGYGNEEGAWIDWRFLGIIEIQDLCENELQNGTEVFSHMFLSSQSESPEIREILEKKDLRPIGNGSIGEKPKAAAVGNG